MKRTRAAGGVDEVLDVEPSGGAAAQRHSGIASSTPSAGWIPLAPPDDDGHGQERR